MNKVVIGKEEVLAQGASFFETVLDSEPPRGGL